MSTTTVLSDYQAFNGRHAETGSVHNVLAYQGVRAPHSGQPPSEALLLGLSGGVTFGYFTFTYSGHLPHLALLTRNTFNPLQTLLNRLGIAQDLRQTGSPDKAEQNLESMLAIGQPVIVWADRFSLPYNHLPTAYSWAMEPIVVYGLELERCVTLLTAPGYPFVFRGRYCVWRGAV
ncbi:BtrH N-terminal domain-containing protein [bacterium]|nr:BtrH N-terminal domain-containing protein [bacterium]